MDCLNHPGVSATAYCQNCGKPMCAQCVRTGPGGQILCEPCLTGWQAAQRPFVAPTNVPSPTTAAVLGIIPGVGAMYNGQFFKGLLHVVIFAVLISLSDHYGIFGIFIAAWVVYQSFEAYHTAVARRDGQPLPDPLGLNELASWLNLGFRSEFQRTQAQGPAPAQGQAQAQAQAQPGQQPMAGAAPVAGNPAAATPPPYTQAGYAQTGYTQASYTQPPPYGAGYPPPPPPPPGYEPGYAPGYTPVSGFTDPAAPVPPVPPISWRRREPIGAIILVGLGLILLLNQLGYVASRIVHYMWPLVFIAIGLWMILRRVGDTKGGNQ